MPQQLDSTTSTARPGTSFSTSTARRQRVERLLMAMAVQQRALLRQRRERQLQAAPARARARGTPRSAARWPPGAARRRPGPSPGIRRASTAGTTARGRRSAAPRSTCGISAANVRRASALACIDQAGRQKRAPAAQRPRGSPSASARDVHASSRPLRAPRAQRAHSRARSSW